MNHSCAEDEDLVPRRSKKRLLGDCCSPKGWRGFGKSATEVEDVAFSLLKVHTLFSVWCSSDQPVRDHTLPKSKRRWLKIGANKGETAMPLRHLAIGFAMVAAMPAVFASAQAGDGLYVPFFTYRTG